jgi:hypothetical protein
MTAGPVSGVCGSFCSLPRPFVPVTADAGAVRRGFTCWLQQRAVSRLLPSGGSFSALRLPSHRTTRGRCAVDAKQPDVNCADRGAAARLGRARALRVGAVALILAMPLCSGCTITIGGGFTPLEDDRTEDNSAAGGGDAPRLPKPTIWRVDPTELTAEQQQRDDEVDQFLLKEQFRDYVIVEVTQGYSGDIIYWVDSNSMPGPYLTPPPPTWTQEDLTPPPGAELARTELELYPGSTALIFRRTRAATGGSLIMGTRSVTTQRIFLVC